MNDLVTKKLGILKAGTDINTGIIAANTGTYVVEAFVLGSQHNTDLELEAGDEIKVINGYNADMTIQFRVRIPDDGQTSETKYITTDLGQVIFEFTNIP